MKPSLQTLVHFFKVLVLTSKNPFGCAKFTLVMESFVGVGGFSVGFGFRVGFGFGEGLGFTKVTLVMESLFGLGTPSFVVLSYFFMSTLTFPESEILLNG